MDALRAHRGLLAVMLLNLTALGGAVWALRDPRAGAVRVELPPTASPAPPSTPVRVHIYVSGAVATPDVVTLPEGARAREAIAAAGGFLATADRAAVNLAAPLADGEQLHVPTLGEPPGAGPPAAVAASGPTAPGPPGLVNVNTATGAELEALPGIGPGLAARILAFRDEHGLFGNPEELVRVPGIGPKTLARFADLVTVR